MYGAAEARRGRHDQLRRTLGKTGLQIVDRHSESLDKLIALARKQDEQITQLQARHDRLDATIKAFAEAHNGLVARIGDLAARQSMFEQRPFYYRLRWFLTGR